MPVISGASSTGTNFKSDRIKFPVSASDPGSAAVGDMYYNTGTNKIKYYNGTAWVNL